MINYADDTTLYSTLDVFGNYISKKLNLELTKVADWFKLNKLSINIKKSKVMVFHMPQKQVIIEIENIKKEFADEFKLVFNCKMRMPGTVKCRPTAAYWVQIDGINLATELITRYYLNETLIQCCFNARPTSAMLAQHWTNIE